METNKIQKLLDGLEEFNFGNNELLNIIDGCGCKNYLKERIF